MPHSNLTRAEAAERAALVSGLSYDVELDLTGDPATFSSRTTLRFACASPGASTFLDLVATEAPAVRVNGAEVDGGFDVETGRLALTSLDVENEVVVEARCAYERTGVGLHRFEDPVDGAIYLYTQFEPFDAHRVYACFDQPDLKATFALTVTAPDDWEVVSNGRVRERAGGRWTFERTPPLPTYITAVVAGPYHVVRDEHRGIPLSVACRRSLAEHLDPGELFEVTKQGFDVFTDVFGMAYPFSKYDQVFVPEFNAGAMENAACVTISERHVYRSKVTDAEREVRAETIVHELAHMWFGNLVTMRWWDDLWLNESFATFMSILALVRGTRFSGAWATFSNTLKNWAARQDQLPSTHPVAADMVDVDAVHLNFDGITYAKGASVLRQLVAWVGEDAFLSGVAGYFRDHAWGNTTLADFLGALEDASGRELAAWSAEWLERAGMNTLRPELELLDGPSGPELARVAVVQEAPEQHPTLRSHRIAVGVYEADGERLVRRERVELDIAGARTEVPQLVGRRAPDLLVVNDDDLTFAKLRLDERSLRTLEERLAGIDDLLTRSLCWSSLWDMLRDAELPARRYLSIVLAHVGAERDVSVVRSLLGQAASAVLVFGDEAHRDDGCTRLAEVAHRLLHAADAGSDLQLSYAHAFIAAARSDGQLRTIRRLLDGDVAVDGLAVDTDLRWAIVGALAAQGAADDALVAAELGRDPTDAGHRHAAAARASFPEAEAKRAAWRTITDAPDVAFATMEATMAGFRQPGQEALLEAWVEPYFDQLRPMWDRRVPEVALSFAEAMFPATLPSEALVARTGDAMADLPAPLQRVLLEARDQLQRVIRTRACDAGAGPAS